MTMSREPQTNEHQDGSAPANETTSLLSKVKGLVDRTTGDQDDEVEIIEEEESGWQLVFHEFGVLLRGSVPVILAYSLQNSLQTLSIVVVGRGPPEDLATAAFAYMFAMATAWLIGLGELPPI